MAEERQILEMNARAIAILHIYHSGERSSRARALMASEIREVAAWFGETELGRAGTVARVLKPVAAELIERYGPREGARLNADFVEAFGARAGSWPLTSPSRV